MTTDSPQETEELLRRALAAKAPDYGSTPDFDAFEAANLDPVGPLDPDITSIEPSTPTSRRSRKVFAVAAACVGVAVGALLAFNRPDIKPTDIAAGDPSSATSVLDQQTGGDASTSPMVESGVIFSKDCSVLIRVYNASSRSGIAGKATDTASTAIVEDPTLSGSMLEPRNAAVVEEAVTWVLSEGADCADLDRLGLPDATRLEQAVDPSVWAALDFEPGSTPQIAIILGARYQG
ncbi:MAG: hypothetical protein R2733_24465 [Acidimicrobiales bacterium]